MPIHRHADKNESFVVLRGKVRSTTYNDDGTVIESVVLCQENGGRVLRCGKGVGEWRGESETCVCGGGEFEEEFYDLPANGNKKQG